MGREIAETQQLDYRNLESSGFLKYHWLGTLRPRPYYRHIRHSNDWIVLNESALGVSQPLFAVPRAITGSLPV